MKVELFPFQKIALSKLRAEAAEANGSYQRTHTPQVISYTAPTGAGKTIIISSFIESIYFGDEFYSDQINSIFVWLSDSPELNEQSKLKIDTKADKIRLDQCVTISDDSFDQEILEDGQIYFLNTQKLSKSSNLVKRGDNRTYTIWDTLKNTVDEKADRLYFIIDEAHRGMQGREAVLATTIMQKFIKGSPEDNLPQMPLIIGMTATPERFNTLVSGTMSTTRRVVTTADEVRTSGLLKDKIIITYPDTANNDIALLQAAAEDWKEKCEHWHQYCFEQHYAHVNPIFVIQVLNNTGNGISDTDLDDCIRKIEERTKKKFHDGEVVHTFGQTFSNLSINGLSVNYVQPSSISDNRRIKLVFFKENLSTGWDCPRAETMMSFRRAYDATYIAQLLGRMVRTPMQMRIQVDDLLNDVHLYLPYFNASTVKNVVEALQNSEGGNIPMDIFGEEFGMKVFDTLTIRPGRPTVKYQPGTEGLSPTLLESQGELFNTDYSKASTNFTATGRGANIPSLIDQDAAQVAVFDSLDHRTEQTIEKSVVDENSSDTITQMAEAVAFNREEILKVINAAGLLSYDVRNVRIYNYLRSLYSLAHLLSQSALRRNAFDEVVDDIVKMIHEHINNLKESGDYDNLSKSVLQFKLNTQIFDAFGQIINNSSIHDMLSTTDTDVDRQLRLADAKLGNEGIANAYGKLYYNPDEPNEYKVEIIIFAADTDCYEKLNAYAKSKFHKLNDDYRQRTIGLSDKFKKRYNDIVSNGDIVSKHNFEIPETIVSLHCSDGKLYSNHLFVDNSGTATIKLNGWEEGVLVEEAAHSDFVCWLRNPPRKPWSLCIPYEMGGEMKPTYPDFIVIRKSAEIGYIIDILEPHDPTRTDNLGKAKGFAEYARQNPGVGRLQLIRMGQDPSGKARFKRLDMARSAIRDKVVQHAITNDDLDHIFNTDGFSM